MLTGFKDIHVIDLDTIETSNLNRQFLFRNHHVGKSKAIVAASAALALRPNTKITPYHANIKEPQFTLEFFRSFDVVLNGLDNMEARKHVNRLCLAADVPLIESGTAGYLGQVSVHLKGKTECFECQPKQTPKTFPVCTLRNTPDKPIHCVVWAKDMLLKRLFGDPEAPSDLDAAAEEGKEDAAQVEVARRLDSKTFFKKREGENATEYGRRIFERVFSTDIVELLKIEDLWKSRKPPRPLNLSDLMPEPQPIVDKTAGSASRALGLQDHQAMWTPAQCTAVFIEATRQYFETRKDAIGCTEFDKDDPLAVDFVTAAANLRSYNYGIQPQTLFNTKGMAGNIIHAIATTNAIVSGLIVIEALKILSGNTSCTKTTYLQEVASNKRLLLPMSSCEPNPECLSCSIHQAHLEIDTTKTTFQQLLDRVVKTRLSLVEPTLNWGTTIYEEGEGLEDEEIETYGSYLPIILAEHKSGGIKDGTIVSLMDQTQHFNLSVIIHHKAGMDGFELSGSVPTVNAHQKLTSPNNGVAREDEDEEAGDEDDDEPIIVVEGEGEEKEEEVDLQIKTKRALEEGDDELPQPKRKGKSDDSVYVLPD